MVRMAGCMGVWGDPCGDFSIFSVCDIGNEPTARGVSSLASGEGFFCDIIPFIKEERSIIEKN